MDEYLDQLPIKVLPGIGHVLGEKLKKQNVETCGELRKISKVLSLWLFFLIFFIGLLNG